MSKLAVLISDIHFNINTLEIASEALLTAIDKANELKVPLIIAGDLNDTKAIIRAEVANRLIQIVSTANQPVYILEGNHDKINEKGSEHGLNYLAPYATIVDRSCTVNGFNFIPYQSSSEDFTDQLKAHTGIVICHQGFKGAFMGDYIQDKSSADPSIVSNLRIFSGHYHRHQTLGTVTYIGSPYTITFGEANDGPKGFISINDDGTFERHILDLRKHIVHVVDVSSALFPIPDLNKDDLLWIKIIGDKSQLDGFNKKQLCDILGRDNFKLEKIANVADNKESEVETLNDADLLDRLIDKQQDSKEHKERLKQLWRSLLCNF